MFVGKVCSYSVSQYGGLTNVKFTMLGRENCGDSPRFETFESVCSSLLIKSLELVDNNKYCYVYNRFGDGALENFEWSDIRKEWHLFGRCASFKDGKARVAFPL